MSQNCLINNGKRLQNRVMAMKIIYFAIIILLLGVVIFSMLPGSPSRDLDSAARSVENNILLFQETIFSDSPPLKEEMNSCIYLFNGATDSISANIHRQYNIPDDFEYSLVGLLLQYKKEIFSLLKSDYRIIIAQIYSETPSKFHTIPYVRIVSKGPKRGVASENILFPTTLITGALYVEKIQINNIPLLELLEISPEGKILNPEMEKRFLEDVAQLSHK